MTTKWKVAFPLSLGAIVAVLALPAIAGAAGPSQDTLAGAAKYQTTIPGLGTLLFPAHEQVNATSDPNGANARGHFFAVIDVTAVGLGVIEVEGNITCLNVSGNTAIDGGVVTASNSPLVPVGAPTHGKTVDNGQGSTATAPDEHFGFLGQLPPTVCNVFPFSTLPIDQGNYTVHDAP
jgi:hypothetical protein